MREQTSSKMLRRSQRRIPARPAARSLRPRTTLLIAAAFGVVALVAGFALRAPVERAIVLGYARNATGWNVDVAQIERIDGGYLFDGVWASTPGGAASLFASRAEFVTTGSGARVVLVAPHVALDPDRWRGDELQKTRDALAHSSFANEPLGISVRNGSALVVAGEVPVPQVAFDGLDGSFTLRGGRFEINGNARLADGDARYPITVQTSRGADGSPVTAVHADAIPLAPLAAVLPAAGDLRVTGGMLRGIDASDGAAFSATFQCDDLAGTLGTHALTALRGPVVFAANGVGSKGLSGLLDGVPFTASGEVHDLGPHVHFLSGGSNDLASLASLSEQLAAEPRVRSIAVEAEAPGLAFGQYAMTTDHGPLAVSVLAIDPREPTLRFDTAIAEDRVISGGERTSAMGLRTGAVGGINGDYFDIGRTYQPQGMLVRGGELIRGPVNRAVLAIDKTKHVTFGEFQLVGSARIGGVLYPVTQVNDWPAGKVTVITPAFGKVLPPAPATTFARLEPLDASRHHFRVASVAAADAPQPVAFGLAFGSQMKVVPRVGQRVDLTYDTDPSTRDVVAAIGGGPILVRDGEPYEDPDAPAPDERNYRWPVDALAETNSGRMLLVAVDGRHPERSVGMMRPEFSDLLIRLGARNAMALDSGGSVTLVSRAVGDATVSVRNVPSDNSAERWVSDALFLYSAAPPASIVPATGAPTPVPEARPTP